ncbi:MAG: universal stress protein [Lewinellaceae bacterium]|nr:universal stress protein [Saprospiraceae bacterium]MCB9316542.1 universal stress protein [Lewinellaceae bacterium]MCB9330470.1 universal stress protein [Lewinellaceae bacterium]
MTTIQIFGTGDAKMHALRKNLSLALAQYPIQGKVEEISEYNQIYASGVTDPPALMLDGEIVSEGTVPSVDEIESLLRNRNLLRSKLYRLRRIMVPVDLSPASENALLYACQLAHLFDANMEVIYVMDSIFEGAKPSTSGFLSSYRKTMQDEVDAFVRKATKDSDVTCPGSMSMQRDGEIEPGTNRPWLRTNIAFGFPEEVLQAMSQKADLLVMGTTGRGNITRKLFGSVSIAVSKTANCPVLLVPPQAQYKGFHNILYASNFESLDPLTIKQTVAFARRFNGQLHFVHVGQAAETGTELEKRLFEINYVYADANMPFLFKKIVGDDIVECLHEYAFEQRIGLFVFVTHQRSFWEDLLHHSISKDMLLHTSTPVLIIHSESDVG